MGQVCDINLQINPGAFFRQLYPVDQNQGLAKLPMILPIMF